jgi:hypothetical protein
MEVVDDPQELDIFSGFLVTSLHCTAFFSGEFETFWRKDFEGFV